MARYKEKKKSKAPVIIALILILAVAAGGAGYFYLSQINGSVELGETVSVSIPEGSSTQAIADILEEGGVVTSAFGFTALVKKEDAGASLRPGEYTFGPGTVTNAEVLDSLLKGNIMENTVNITIPEGLTVQQTARQVAASGLCTEEEFLQAAGAYPAEYEYIPQGDTFQKLEGFLFPETYNVGADWGASDIIGLMLKQFDSVWTKERRDQAESMGMSPLEVLTVASLVEREARVDEERALIAGVIYNRLEAGMRLQIDATVQYALGEQKDRLLYSDLEIDSPYNTYKNDGLPPGPIASPGLASIDAALYPEQSSYLYYQTTIEGDGSHYFCETLEEHNAYKAQKG